MRIKSRTDEQIFRLMFLGKFGQRGLKQAEPIGAVHAFVYGYVTRGSDPFAEACFIRETGMRVNMCRVSMDGVVKDVGVFGILPVDAIAVVDIEIHDQTFGLRVGFADAFHREGYVVDKAKSFGCFPTGVVAGGARQRKRGFPFRQPFTRRDGTSC